MKRYHLNEKISVLVVIAGLLSLALPVFADVIVDAVHGDVRLFHDGQQWTSLTEGVVVQPGDIVQTGVESDVIIHTADGIVLSVRESSQLKFLEPILADSSPMNQIELLQGTLSIEMPFLRPDKDHTSIQVITAMALINAMTNDSRPTSLQVIYTPSISSVDVYNFGGTVTMRQISNGSANFAGLFGGKNGERKEGLTFPVNQNGTVVDLDVQAELSTIIVKSNLGIGDIVAMLGDYVGMEVTNLDEKSQAPLTLFMPDGENMVTLDGQDEKIFVVTSPANVVLGEAPIYVHSQFKFFRELGTFWMREECDCGGVTWSSGSDVIIEEPPPPPPPLPPESRASDPYP